MGNLPCPCRKDKTKTLTLLVVGLDNAGKTTTVKAILGESVEGVDVVPSVGFLRSEISHKNYKILFYDLGGGERIRAIWKNYYFEVHGVIYVVDSKNQRIDEAKDNLFATMNHPQLQKKPLLILANKQDQEQALDEVELTERLQLEHLANQIQSFTRVELCSAIAGTGKSADPAILSGFTWLINAITTQYNELDSRVESDTTIHKAEEAEEKRKRAERVRVLRAQRTEDDEIVVVNNNPFRPIQELTSTMKLPGSVPESDNTIYVQPNGNAASSPSAKSAKIHTLVTHAEINNPDVQNLEFNESVSLSSSQPAHLDNGVYKSPSTSSDLHDSTTEMQNGSKKHHFFKKHNKTAPLSLNGAGTKELPPLKTSIPKQIGHNPFITENAISGA